MGDDYTRRGNCHKRVGYITAASDEGKHFNIRSSREPDPDRPVTKFASEQDAAAEVFTHVYGWYISRSRDARGLVKALKSLIDPAELKATIAAAEKESWEDELRALDDDGESPEVVNGKCYMHNIGPWNCEMLYDRIVNKSDWVEGKYSMLRWLRQMWHGNWQGYRPGSIDYYLSYHRKEHLTGLSTCKTRAGVDLDQPVAPMARFRE